AGRVRPGRVGSGALPAWDVAGDRLPRSIGRGATAGAVPGRHRPGYGAVRPRRPPPCPPDRLRRGGQLEGDRRELPRVLPLPRRPPPAQQDHAVQPGGVPALERSLLRQLHGSPPRVRDALADGRRRRAADDPRDDPRGRAPGLLLRHLAEPTPQPPPGLPDAPLDHAVGARADAGSLRVVLRPGRDGETRVRPERRDRLLGHDQPPGLARLRAPAAGHQEQGLHPRPLQRDREQRPGLRLDGGRPLRERRHRHTPVPRFQAGEHRRPPRPRPRAAEERGGRGL
ncbi:MAG: Phenylpropionate dioxygenase and related ring-hydroxylating dioxygenases, large terminal subunit, partial [uncultured Thermomicrobiales bacterium]